MLSTPGIGSGLDVNSIVAQLMAVERRPLTQLATQQRALEAQVSAYGQLRSALSTFQSAMSSLSDATRYKVYSATSSDADVLSASATSTAARGVYNVEVVRLAENHRMASSQVFAALDSGTVGTAGDKLTLTVGSASFDVDYGGKTLAEIRDAINTSTANTGVTASAIRDDLGYRLLLSANDTGSAHALTIATTAADPFQMQTLNGDRDLSGGFTAADLDAQVKLEGQFTATRSSNSITDLIDGVTVTLTGTGTTRLSVDRDTARVKSAIGDVVNAYNQITTVTGALGRSALSSDKATLVSVESSLRAILNAPNTQGSAYQLVSQIGITTKKDGALEINDSTLSRAISDDFNGMAQLFADPARGIAVRFRELADQFLGAGGFLASRSGNLDQQLRDVARRQTDMQYRLQITEDRLRRQYGSLDTVVSQLQRTSTFLTQQLGRQSGTG